MRHIIASLLLLASAFAGAENRVQVLEVDPAPPATLSHWEHFYLRIAYDVDQPVRIRGDAYSDGKKVTQMNGGSPRYEPGKGEALFWFAFTRAQKVDRIVVYAAEGRSEKPIVQAEYKVDLRWTGQTVVAERPRAEWVTHLRAETDRRINQEMQAHASQPTSWWGIILVQAVMACVPIYLVLQVVLLCLWRGRWRMLAALALIPMALVIAHAIFAFFAGSNIFPLILIFTSPVAVVYLIALLIIKRRVASA